MYLPQKTVYNTGNCHGPGCMTVIEHNHTAVYQTAFRHNLLWVFTCQVDQVNHVIPQWTASNISVHPRTNVESDTINYLPAIHASAIEIAPAAEKP